MSKIINESWWRGIRCGLRSPVCAHSDPIAIEVFHFPRWGWIRQGHRTGVVLCHSPNQLTKSVLAQSRQVTSSQQVSQVETGLLSVAGSIPNVCLCCLLVICLPVWDDSLLTFEHRLWPWVVARDVKTVFMSKMTWWTERCICRHEKSAAD